jgi:hypothetical protein
MESDELEEEKLMNFNIDAKDMYKLIKKLEKLKINFEVYVEYDYKKNPEKVWDNENNSNQ